MEFPCEHCQTQLPLASLSFCRDCCVSFCSACCFENHSASGENGRLQFHEMSTWSESNQKEAACLILAHLTDRMEEVKTNADAELVQFGQRIDRLKDLLHNQMRVQMDSRLSHLQGSVRSIRDAFNVTDIDCVDLSTSRRSFEAEARFLLDKLVDGGLRIDLHPEANPVMLEIRRVSDISDALCSSNDPFIPTVENSAAVETVPRLRSESFVEDANMPGEPPSASDERVASDDISEGAIVAQRGPSGTVQVKEELDDKSLEGASDNEADVDVLLFYEDRTASSLLSNSLLSIDFDPEYARLVQENKKKREAVLKVKEASRQKEIARLQRLLLSKAREVEATEPRHSSKRTKSRSRRHFSEIDKVKHFDGAGSSRRHNSSPTANRSKQRSDEDRRHSSGKNQEKHPRASADGRHKSSSSATGRSKRHSTCFDERRSHGDSASEDPDNGSRSAKSSAGISRTSTAVMFPNGLAYAQG